MSCTGATPGRDCHETPCVNPCGPGRRAGPPQARPDPLGGSIVVLGDRGVVMSAPLVEIKGVHKTFGGVRAVEDVSLQLFPGEVVAVLGHNGAGKSTLMKMLAGAFPIDQGEIRVNGERAALAAPSDAQALGIETIYQTLALADNLDSVSNLFLG